MNSRAYVEFDLMQNGIRLALLRERGTVQQVVLWGRIAIAESTEDSRAEPDPEAWLHLPTEDARAIYEALADYFGHAGHDIRALRKDYEAERKRVDLFIAKAVQS